mmetsp:Transcript_38710/g.51003  ORF Transcript_38710/g.51003 Transcript_38710/m.51003 type:complete len:551 (-) Transcript_38710:259-1911(-)
MKIESRERIQKKILLHLWLFGSISFFVVSSFPILSSGRQVQPHQRLPLLYQYSKIESHKNAKGKEKLASSTHSAVFLPTKTDLPRDLKLHAARDDENSAPVEGLDMEIRGGQATSTLGWYPYLALGSLLLIYIHNQWSRSLIYYIVNFSVESTPEAAKEYINVALNFDQASYSVLASFGFTLLYSFMSVFAGRAADVLNKKLLAIGAALTWSLSTLASGFAQSFQQVFGLRVLTGLAQAFTNPAAYSMIAQTFPQDKRAFANSLYATGAYYGGGLASLTILLSSNFGWRMTSMGVGVLGIGLAILGFLILRGDEAAKSEPSPSTVENKDKPGEIQPSFQEAVGTVLSSPIVRALFCAAAIRFCAGYGIGTWAAPYLQGAFPDYKSQYSLLNSIVVGTGGVISATLGGIISDKFVSQDLRTRAWVCASGCLLAIPCWAAVCLSPNFYVAMFALFLEYIVAECWFGPSTAILQDALPANVRGVGQGLFGLLISVGNIAPVVMGTLMTKYDYTLQTVLLWSVGLLYLLSSLLFINTGEVQLQQKNLLANDKED